MENIVGRRALLLVDRGSREADVKQELSEICLLVKSGSEYDYVDYCFLEVIPPFIAEGIDKCITNGAESITVVPYFLYPGMKLKDAVKKSAKLGKERNVKIVIAKPLSYHPTMAELVLDRIAELKNQESITHPDKDCDILLIGHGSSDRNARDAFMFTANNIKTRYRDVHVCFLELDHPNIEEGIAQVISTRPEAILMVPYFLHRGAHIKRDVVKEVSQAINKYGFRNAFMSRHLGVDSKLAALVIERAMELEARVNARN